MRKLSLGIVLFGLAWAAQGGPRDALWQKVEDAKRRGLPRTAITNLEAIFRHAITDRAYAEAARAVGDRIVLEGTIQGNKPEEKITRLQGEIPKLPKAMAPALEVLLADWYWEYFKQNNWRFMQRTATGEPPGKDFTTWDLPRLFAEINRHFDAGLADQAVLKSTPIGQWNDLLQKGTMPDSYRPTLYDFVAHEALEFYTSGEQAGARPEQSFELASDSPVLGSAEQFISWRPGPENPTNGEPALQAIALYQDLLRFHREDPPPRVAYADVNLERLTWAWNTAVGDDKNSRYKAALQEFIERYSDNEISALALWREAVVWQAENDLVKARAVAEQGARKFPETPGGKLCRNLVKEIEQKSANISTERVWSCFDGKAPGDTNNCPMITVDYCNVTNLYFRAIPYNWETLLTDSNGFIAFESPDQKKKEAILSGKPAIEWVAALSPTTNYQQVKVQIPAPQHLKPGFYFIAASHDANFDKEHNMVAMVPVWVSDLALVTRERPGRIDGFVLDADSGEPIAGAEVSLWRLNDQNKFVAHTPLRTDEKGQFSIEPSDDHGYVFRARHNGIELATSDERSMDDMPDKYHPQATTVFFTDRAIYRPGQTVQYKGICLWVDTEKNKYQVLKHERLTVVFKDANDKEVARQRQRVNDYGSFAGSFTAPRDRLMGKMSLEVEGHAEGSATFRVEEYKRPKFEVTLDAPKTAVRLNEQVTITGHALAYTGAAVDGAKVSYHVVREVRTQSGSRQIVHGLTRTEQDGTFTLVFPARPDEKLPEKDEPVFDFRIQADVTDSAGETCSVEHTIHAGYTALEARMSADDWQEDGKPVELRVETKSLDDEPLVAEGNVKVYALQAPETVQRSPVGGGPGYVYVANVGRVSVTVAETENQTNDLSDPDNWPLGKVVAEQRFTTDTNGVARLRFALGTGVYRTMLETKDRFGKKVTGRLLLQVLKLDDKRLAIKIPNLVAAPEWEVQPGQNFVVLWGTGYETGRAFVEIEHRHKIIRGYWTQPGRTQERIELPITEDLRGGFILHVTQVRDNRAYLVARAVDVPWKNKELTLKWTHFVSKLQPDQKETWGVEIQGPKAEKAAAEMVATLYDESLDAFEPNNWDDGFDVFYKDDSGLEAEFQNTETGFESVWSTWLSGSDHVSVTYRSFPGDWGVPALAAFGNDLNVTVTALARHANVSENLNAARIGNYFSGIGALNNGNSSRALGFDWYLGNRLSAVPYPSASYFGGGAYGGYSTISQTFSPRGITPLPSPKPAHPDLSMVSARKNLNETAFFYPQLTSDANGVVQLSFTMPEAVTKWRFMAFAHDARLRAGYLEAHAVTAKDLMVQPNPPRFLREGDIVEFTVKVSNQSDTNQSGAVRLNFNLATTGGSADRLLDLRNAEQAFDIPAKESRSFSWRIAVPDGCSFLTYKAVAASASASDGEEGPLPVLARLVLVTESLPLPIRGAGTKKFAFEKLLKSGGSKTLRNEGLTVQMVSHPAWYAVLALPYLMEFPHECSEQVFNRFYANALARHIAGSNPKIRRIFDQWKHLPTLDSPLEKNQELKAVMLEETPWLQDAEKESQARRNVGILFDENRLNYEQEATLTKLAQMQLEDGSWPWFPGGRGNDFITLYITTGFGRLRHLGVDVGIGPALKSLARLDQRMDDEYAQIQRGAHPEQYALSATDALYLYGRSFFLKDQPIGRQHTAATKFFLSQARKFWLETGYRQTQAQLALALKRFAAADGGGDTTPKAILASLKERSVEDEELGRFWRDTEEAWWWYRAPIETQALMIEAFDEVAGDADMVEACRVWLLKQKQTRDWRTTKATADAVYALLLRGTDLLLSDALVDVKLGGVDVTAAVQHQTPPENGQNSPFEPGTGFYEYRFAPADIKPRLGEITVKKKDQGVAWGSVHWQYLEDMSKLTPYAGGTPLQLSKKLYVKINTAKGKELDEVKGPIKVGDELVVRLVLRTDRDMEFVHLKDQRGSGLEPVDVLSGYRYQDGLANYESTRDTATHFFIDYLRAGTYVFEYSARVQLRGQYQSGFGQIQCMYAPEFNSHSESVMLDVR